MEFRSANRICRVADSIQFSEGLLYSPSATGTYLQVLASVTTSFYNCVPLYSVTYHPYFVLKWL